MAKNSQDPIHCWLVLMKAFHAATKYLYAGLAHYIKDVPEVTANGMAQVEQLFDKLDAGEQVVQ